MSRKINNKNGIGCIIALGIIIWLITLRLKGISPLFTINAIKQIPSVIGWVFIIFILFSKWGWKYLIFRKWLVLIPNINGTWEGELTSTWEDPNTGKTPDPIKVFLVIRQSLFDISCCQITKESKSYSRAASFLLSASDNIHSLEFTYSNYPRPTVQHRSKAHDGACFLELIEQKGQNKLIGKYWTERKTTGEISLTFKSRKFLQTFEQGSVK